MSAYPAIDAAVLLHPLREAIRTPQDVLFHSPRLTYLIHKVAVDHGWWGEAPNLAEKVALIHTEIAEADDYGWEVMDDHLPQYPGELVELADIIIRALDLLGYISGRNTLYYISFDADEAMPFLFSCTRSEGYGKLHSLAAKITESLRKEDPAGDHRETLANIAKLVRAVCAFAESKGAHDLGSIVVAKIEYNCSRPFKHGGKKF